MNSLKFNIYLGIFTIIGHLFLPVQKLLDLPVFIIVFGLIALYIGEFWAFLYKLRSARVKNLYELSNGNPSLKVGELKDPGCMMFYAFLIRFVFRFAILLFAYIFLFGEPEGELNWWTLVFLIILVLFELFSMLYSIYETHIFRLKTDDDNEEDDNNFWLKEKEWRTKVFKEYRPEMGDIRLKFAEMILFLSGCALTALFWDGCNQEFVDYIKRSAAQGESAIFIISLVLIACTVLCLFFLMPVKLAFWIEKKMNADTPQEQRRYKWSIVFAGISVSAPSLIQLVKTFGFGL